MNLKPFKGTCVKGNTKTNETAKQMHRSAETMDYGISSKTLETVWTQFQSELIQLCCPNFFS